MTPQQAKQRLHALYQDQCSYVANTLRRLGIPMSEVEDRTHEVFMRVYRLLPTYQWERPVRPWLFSICSNIAHEYRRTKTHVPIDHDLTEEHAEAFVDDALPADEMLERVKDHELIYKALNVLSPLSREVFILHEIDEQPMSDIASALAIPLQTGYSRLRHGRQQFEKALRALLSSEAR